MFILEGERIACVQCIRGHRAADCFHRRKPLISIKSRGRPPQHEKNIRCRYQNVFITHQGKEPIETKNGRADPGVTKKAMYVHPCCKYTLVRVRLGKGFSILSELTLAEAKIFLQGKEDDFKYDCLDWERQGHSCSPQELENNGGGRLFMETRFDQQECPRPQGKDDNHENYPERPPRAFSKEETHALQELSLRSGLHSHLNSEIAAGTTFEELLDRIPEVVIELPQMALPQQQTYFQESQEQQTQNFGYNAPAYTHQFEEPNYSFPNNDRDYSALVHTAGYEISPPSQNPQKQGEKAFYNSSIGDSLVDNDFVEEAKHFNFAIMFKEEEENIVPLYQPPPLPSTNYEDGCVLETIQVKAIPQSNVHLNPSVFREYNQAQQYQTIHVARQVKKESEERARKQMAEAEIIKKHTFITQNHHCLVTDKILFINDRAFGLAPSDKHLRVGQPYGQYKVMQTDTGVKFLIPPVILDEAQTNKIKQLTATANDHQLQYQANASQAQAQSQVQDYPPRVPAPAIDQFSTEQFLFENQESLPMSDEEFNNFLRVNNLTEETFTESTDDHAKSNEFVGKALSPSSEPVQESIIQYEDPLEFIQQFEQTQQVELQIEESQSDTELRLNQWVKSLEDQGQEENPNHRVQPQVSLAQVVNFKNVELPAPVENGELFNDKINLDELFANGFNLEQDGFLQDDQFSQCFNEFNQPYLNGPEQREN